MTSRLRTATVSVLLGAAALIGVGGCGGKAADKATEPGGPTFYLRADDGTTGLELFRTDGTAAGTRLVKDINTNSDGNPKNLATIGGVTYFAASDGVKGRELWKTDGTAAGTSLVKDINPGAPESSPSSLTVVGSVLYFLADDGIHGRELWRSDGTAAGTVLVQDVNGDADRSGFNEDSPLVVIGSTLFFMGSAGLNGEELWKSDGTAAGTVLVKDVNGGLGSSDPFSLIAVGGTLFFTAYDGSSVGLWKSDGTAAGTELVKARITGIARRGPREALTANAPRRSRRTSRVPPSSATGPWRSASRAPGATARSPRRSGDSR